MRVIDLGEEHEPLYHACLEDWSEEILEAGDHKARWHRRMRDRGLRVKLALDETGTVGGMIQYVPIEQVLLEGRDLYFVLCIWVHGHKQGRGDFQKRGMGTALIEAAERDARALGAHGMAAWGLALPFWMKASWFKKHGYRKADSMDGRVLLFKPFREDVAPPRWIHPKKKPEPRAGVVTVTGCINGWCPGMSIAYERAKRVAGEFGDDVRFEAVDTFDLKTAMEWGLTDAVFVDHVAVRMGPPPSCRKIRKLVTKRVRKVQRARRASAGTEP